MVLIAPPIGAIDKTLSHYLLTTIANIIQQSGSGGDAEQVCRLQSNLTCRWRYKIFKKLLLKQQLAVVV